MKTQAIVLTLFLFVVALPWSDKSQGSENSAYKFDMQKKDSWENFGRFKKLFYLFEDMKLEAVRCKLVTSVDPDPLELLRDTTPLESQGYKVEISIEPEALFSYSGIHNMKFRFPIFHGSIDVDPKHPDAEKLRKSLNIRKDALESIKVSLFQIYTGSEMILRDMLSQYSIPDREDVTVRAVSLEENPAAEISVRQAAIEENIKYELKGKHLTANLSSPIHKTTYSNNYDMYKGKLRLRHSSMSSESAIFGNATMTAEFSYQNLLADVVFLDKIHFVAVNTLPNGKESTKRNWTFHFKDCTPSGMSK